MKAEKLIGALRSRAEFLEFEAMATEDYEPRYVALNVAAQSFKELADDIEQAEKEEVE